MDTWVKPVSHSLPSHNLDAFALVGVQSLEELAAASNFKGTRNF
ncbi:MAG: hypothetical protein NW224_26760 [Leptolyngbyaceae cyanobacterium bins.302]|nr:hypothetical protein [Leptolyngbyaceae cyanobacterium bins.302]